jgi:hypothetical protein
MATSENGYQVLFSNRTHGDLPRLRKVVIPGTGRHLFLRDGSVAMIIAHFVLWFHQKIEPINNKVWDEWGWAVRPKRGQTSGYSNHASGTAADINATLHPLGRRWTFKAWQYTKMRARLALYAGCLRLGIDYKIRPDEMHVEINRSLKYCEKVARMLCRTKRGKRILKANPGLREVIFS